jgi:hypothetical protein
MMQGARIAVDWSPDWPARTGRFSCQCTKVRNRDAREEMECSVRLSTMTKVCLVLLAAITFVACSDSDDSSPVGGGADASTDSSTPTDAGSQGLDSGNQADSGGGEPDAGQDDKPPATDLKLDAKAFFKGKFYITGTLQLPAGATAGRGVQLNVIADGLKGNFVGYAGMTKDGTSQTYAITGLPAGTYKVQARVDQSGNQMLGDTGDYDGYARGTVASPKTTAGAADPIVVNASVTAVDFGLGVVP